MSKLIAERDGKEVPFDTMFYNGVSLAQVFKYFQLQGFDFLIQRPATGIELFEKLEQMAIKAESERNKKEWEEQAKLSKLEI